MTGPTIPGLRYLQHVGQGGFADVFLYEQDWPRQQVAVKVVRPDVALTPREKEMFTAEANSMARLADHPYIVSVLTAGVTSPGEGSRPYLVMRYCPPPDLGQRVHARPLSVQDGLSTGIKLASAIETAHRWGILHRDIKPSNVLVTTYQEPALTDFGIAGSMHEVEADVDVRISYPWSPPELLDGRSNGSIASDVYSLGATIWNLLVGRSPFSIPGGDNSTRALTARILHSAPPRTQRPDVPPALDLLLQQCLSKEPGHRPERALELARSLQRIEAQSGFARTAISVESEIAAAHNPTAPTAGSPDADDDATALKPITVISGSSPRVAIEDRPDTDGEVAAPTRSAIGWWVAGAATLALVVGFVVWQGSNGNDTSRPTETPTSTSTPIAVDPSAPQAEPDVLGERKGDRVTFTWSSLDGKETGDTWEWLRNDNGEQERTPKTSLTITSPDRVCLQVRLIRGSFASPYGNKCVD